MFWAVVALELPFEETLLAVIGILTLLYCQKPFSIESKEKLPIEKEL